jgi:SAM-dependent MidA family methyltransferase
MGILEELADHYDANPFSETSKKNRAIRSLIMPGSMSNSFDVIIQGKGIDLQADQLFSK